MQENRTLSAHRARNRAVDGGTGPTRGKIESCTTRDLRHWAVLTVSRRHTVPLEHARGRVGGLARHIVERNVHGFLPRRDELALALLRTREGKVRHRACRGTP